MILSLGDNCPSKEVDKNLDNLSQSEIDALLSGAAIASTENEEPSTTGVGSYRRNYRLYDFRRPDKLSKEQLRSLRANFGRFTRSASNYLAALTRSSVDAKLVEIDQVGYGQLFRSHGIPTLFCVFKLAEEFPAILKLNLSQLYAALDRIMGGPGSGTLLTRPLTEFERGLMGDICDQLLQLWLAEFRTGDVGVELEVMDTDERMIPRSLANDEFMVRGLYDLRLGPSNGQISVYTPLKSLTRLIGKFGNTEVECKGSGLPKALSQNIKQLPLPVAVDLGSAWLDGRQISALQPGDLIQLHQEESQPVTVRVGGVPRFAGRPGILGRKMAVRIDGRYKETS